MILNTDSVIFGGKDRVTYDGFFPIIKEYWCNRPNYIQIYLPSRTAIVLISKENLKKKKLTDELHSKQPLQLEDKMKFLQSEDDELQSEDYSEKEEEKKEN